jgi:hypothetical protein
MAYPSQPQAGYAPAAPRPRKKRRIFLWVFLLVQVIFLIVLITGLHHNATTINPQVAYECAHGKAASMGMSQSQCVSFLGGAAKTGTAAAVVITIIAWCVVDFLLAVTYGIYRLARR